MEPVEPLHRTSFMHPVSEHLRAVEAAKREHISLALLIRRALKRELDRVDRLARRSA